MRQRLCDVTEDVIEDRQMSENYNKNITDMDIRTMINGVKTGEISVDDAVLELKKKPFEDIDFAKVDLHRSLRQGTGEVIYGAGKTAEQIIAIADTLKKNGQEHILITRVSPEKAGAISQLTKHNIESDLTENQIEPDKSDQLENLKYYEEAHVCIIGGKPEPNGIGTVLVITGGTSDIPVAEEAAVTAEFLGNKTKRLYDVGVAGLHRLLSHLDEIMSASVIIAIAGMEGALASVVGGLADCPVIAVPTSIGYGASFGGVSALLSMLNSCASGVSVVNIDNGFGAAYTASMINHRSSRAQ